MFNCWICKDKGIIIVKSYRDGYRYDCGLHCSCSAGNAEKTDYTNERTGVRHYSEPISKYYDVTELARKNKESYTNNNINIEKNEKKLVDVMFEKIY